MSLVLEHLLTRDSTIRKKSRVNFNIYFLSRLSVPTCWILLKFFFIDSSISCWVIFFTLSIWLIFSKNSSVWDLFRIEMTNIFGLPNPPNTRRASPIYNQIRQSHIHFRVSTDLVVANRCGTSTLKSFDEPSWIALWTTVYTWNISAIYEDKSIDFLFWSSAHYHIEI